VNIRGMLSGVRIHTRDPRAQQPSDRTILKKLSIEVQTFLTELNIYGRNYSVDETVLTISPNNAEYQIGLSDFGKPIEVRTTDPGNPSYIERTIDFFELGDLHFEWDMPNDFGQSYWGDGSGHSTQRIAFYRKAGNVFARILPVPAQPARLSILYQVGVFGSTVPLDENLIAPEHHALIEVRTAIAVLPHCEWDDNESINQTRRKELGVALGVELDRLTKTFRSNLVNQSANDAPTYRELDSIDD